MLSYVAKHSKQRKSTKVIKLQWIASIWCQKHQTNAKLQKWSYFDEFASIWRQNDQNFWVTSQNYKSNQITMNCIDFKTIKNLSYVAKHSKQRIQNQIIELHQFDVDQNVAKHSKQRKTTKVIKLQWIASIWCHIKPTQNYKSDLISMFCIDLTSKRSKNAKLHKQSNNDQFPSIWGQNDQKF